MPKLCLSLFLLFFSTHSMAFFDFDESKCDKLPWTKADNRTQGGGWVWFPGKGRDSSKEMAKLKAEGEALEKLIKECQFPHKEIKVHEQCIDEIGDSYKVYLRLSLLEDQCRESKYAKGDLRKKIENKELTSTYKRYRKQVLGLKGEKQNCDNLSAQACHKRAKHFYFLGKTDIAFSMFEKACEQESHNSCFNAGIIATEREDVEAAKGFFNVSCRLKDSQGCYFLSRAHSQDGEDRKAKKALKMSCDLGENKACRALAEQFSGRERAKMLAKICDKGDPRACHEASIFYYESGNKSKMKKYAKESCQLELPKGCYNYANALLKSKKESEAIKYFEKACGLSLAPACYKVSTIDKRRKLKFLVKACDSGDAKSCKEASTMYYDKKNNEKSLLYAKYSCKLGIQSSCYNSGFLEMKNGHKKQAQAILEKSCDDGFERSCNLLEKL